MRVSIKSSRGDTIVEVLLAIAITSVVLAGAYVAVSGSMKASRAAQERGEAVKKSLKRLNSHLRNTLALRNLQKVGL